MLFTVEDARRNLCHVLGLDPEHTTFAPVAVELCQGKTVRVHSVQVSRTDDGLAEIVVTSRRRGA